MGYGVPLPRPLAGFAPGDPRLLLLLLLLDAAPALADEGGVAEAEAEAEAAEPTVRGGVAVAGVPLDAALPFLKLLLRGGVLSPDDEG